MFEINFFSHPPDAITQMARERLQSVQEDWEKQVWQFIIDWFNPEIRNIQVSTSGSTGIPKQIEHTKSAMLHSAGLTCRALGLKHGANALLCLPVSKIGGMMMVVRSIYNKMNMVCIKPSTKPFQEISDNMNIDFAAFTPMQFHEITASNAGFRKANQFGKIILGGEAVRAELLANIKKLESEVYITFGMTETISHIALKRLNGPTPDQNFKVLPGIDISVNTDDRLVINAPLLGAVRLVTNDAVKLEAKNEFQWLGRVDNVINSGGVKIHPEEIEQRLAGIIEAPFFIASVSDKISGEKLVLVLEMNAIKDVEKAELKESFSRLEKLHRPKEVILIKHFIRTRNGKIKRRESLSKIDRVVTLSDNF